MGFNISSSAYLLYIIIVLICSNCYGLYQNQVFEVEHEWKKLDFEYPTYVQRQNAIANGAFIPENNLPLGIDRHNNRLFITTPRWKDGVPASLNYLDYPTLERSPALKPYPNWAAHADPYAPDCTNLMSVYRTYVDICDRLWLIDSGIVNATVSLNQVCPPKIVVYDLHSDEKLLSFELPPEQVKQDSLHSNIIVNVKPGKCNEAFAYVTDVWRYGLVVFSLAELKTWRVTNFLFSPEPRAADFNLYDLNFQWLDGIFGMSLSRHTSYTENWEQYLYYHPMASTKEYILPTRLLHNESLAEKLGFSMAHEVYELGDRGERGQSSTSGIDRNGIMFFTQVQRDNIACWNTALPYEPKHISLLLTKPNNLIRFPNDLKVDHGTPQNIWVISNSLPIYLYSALNYSEVNFRILRANVEEAVAETVCSTGL